MGLYERLRIDNSGVGKITSEWTQVGASFTIREATLSGFRTKRVAVYQCKCGECFLRPCAKISGGSQRCQNCNIGRFAATRTSPRPAEYETWKKMVQRCESPKCNSYKNYGGRGIRVCERWHNSAAFYEDMGPRPSPQHTLDRIDNDGDYCPENCRWVTRQENNRNKRNTVFISHNGETVKLAEIAASAGLSPSLVYNRIVRYGWSVAEAIGEPVRSKGRARRQRLAY